MRALAYKHVPRPPQRRAQLCTWRLSASHQVPQPASQIPLAIGGRFTDHSSMGDHTQDLPVFSTRDEVANLLRITKRHVDNFSKAGVLNNQKIGTSRSGFGRSGVDSCLHKMRGETASTAPDTRHAGQAGEVPTLDSIRHGTAR
jgi:hypothetical protein